MFTKHAPTKSLRLYIAGLRFILDVTTRSSDGMSDLIHGFLSDVQEPPGVKAWPA